MSEPVEGSGGRRRLILAVVVGLAAGLSLLAAFVGKRRVPPYAPADAAHSTSLSERQAGACLGCHARDTPLDRPRGHTGRQDCWNCHQMGAP